MLLEDLGNTLPTYLSFNLRVISWDNRIKSYIPNANSFQDSYLLFLLLPAGAIFHLLNLRKENKEQNYNALPNGLHQLRKAALPFYFNKIKIHSHVLVKLHKSPDTTGGTVTKAVALTVQGSPHFLGFVAKCGRRLPQTRKAACILVSTH